ncbi:MAG: 16S rRNA (cytosine(967)-C(5))-methyltransferase RsmB [Burkholderiaceae bacterium]|nr:16S rRNA (cytosine(967)-C(5))-methyltransferase RsmB [Burkholderiaceae bacterium]
MQPPSPPLHRLLGQTADVVAAVRGGRSLTELLAACPAELRGGTQALSFQVMRTLGAAQAARARLAPRPPPPAVDALLLAALALLWPADAPPPYAEHTLVDQAVTAARARTPAAARFVNAVLRRFVRERAALAAALQRDLLAAHNHPPWWIARLQQDWPAQWPALLAAANRHPPMALRVNARRGSASSYVDRLAAAGQAAVALDDPAFGGQAVVLERPCAVHELPGFAAGEVSVQDLSAQRAAPLLLGGAGLDGLPPLAAGARVLDACAAPGGKTAHLLERADLDLLALDSEARRLQRVQDNLARLQLPAAGGAGRVRLQAADARQVSLWWDGRPFDAILLDAPCTASGIVRRHPDVRWLRRPGDVAALAALQCELLDALWPLLAAGGRLVYATCSIFKAEGRQQIDAFLQRHAADSPHVLPASPGHLLGVPDNPDQPVDPLAGDGFFYAVIHKP